MGALVCSVGFVEPKNEVVGILGFFDRINHHSGIVDAEEAFQPGFGRSGKDLERVVEGRGFRNDSAQLRSVRVGKKGVAETMPAHVGGGVGRLGRAQEREREDVAQTGVAVFRIVQQGDAVAGLGEIGPAVRADLKPGEVPGGVEMRGPAHMAELNFVGRIIAAQCERKFDFEELIFFAPIDLALEIETRRFGIEGDALRQGALRADFIVELDDGAQGAGGS